VTPFLIHCKKLSAMVHTGCRNENIYYCCCCCFRRYDDPEYQDRLAQGRSDNMV